MQKKQVTMKDIAREMDVSIVTVSKALAGKDGVSEELRVKIADKARELGYISNVRKRGMHGEISVAIMISERFVHDRSFYVKIYQKMIMELSSNGYIGILEILRRDNEENGILPMVISMETVQQIIVIGEMKSSFIERLQETGLKLIFFDFQNEEFDVDQVVGDSVNGGYTLTRYLFRNGYERVGFVGNYKATRSILDRYMGYLKYLVAKNHAIREDWVLSDRDANGRFIEVVLPKADMPQAFVCNCDEAAYRLIRTLEREGYRVPEDIAVVGYDDYAAQETGGVELTTYHVNVEEMIRQCIRIIEACSYDPAYRHGIVTVAGRLIVRETVKERQ